MSLSKISAFLQSLANVGSLPVKEKLLRMNDSEFLREILKAAYDPYVTYGIKTESHGGNFLLRGSVIPRDFKETSWEEFRTMLDELSKRQLTGQNAISAVWCYMTHNSYSLQWLFHGILNKDFGVGISAKTINKAFPGLVPEFKASKANDWNPKKVTFPALAEVKYDGKRIVAFVTSSGVTLYSYNGLVEKKYQHIRDELLNLRANWDKDFAIDGELMWGMFGERKEENINFIVFDAIPLETFLRQGQTLSQLVRTAKVVQLVGFPGAPHIQATQSRAVNSIAEIGAFYQEVVNSGGEGLMVKNLNSPYEYKRGWAWMKMKPVKDVDLEIVGVFEGEGKYEGMLGGIIVNYKGVSVRVGTGFDDQFRKYWWVGELGAISDGLELIGRVAEIRYTEITPDGSLRFPRFVRLRSDK